MAAGRGQEGLADVCACLAEKMRLSTPRHGMAQWRVTAPQCGFLDHPRSQSAGLWRGLYCQTGHDSRAMLILLTGPKGDKEPAPVSIIITVRSPNGKRSGLELTYRH